MSTEQSPKSRRASCTCGQLTAVAVGEPVRISMCHCLACQLRTGSVFGAQARFPEGQVTVSGRWTRYARTADSGSRVTYRFCPECGATVCFELDQAPGMVAIPVGAFADPEFPAPRISIYEARKHAWVTAPEGAEHLD